MMHAKKINDEVYIAEGHVVQVSQENIETFNVQATRTARHRARLCAHKQNENRIHEMFIALTRDAYIRPHRHLNKSESFHVIEGTAVVIFFEEDGRIQEMFEIGDFRSGKAFYYRNEDERFHTQIVTSARLVFHETTNGPFNRADTILAPWSPVDTDLDAVKSYMEGLRHAVAQLK